MQLRVALCVVCLVGTRIVNLYVPIFYKHVVDQLGGTGHGHAVTFPVNDILLYVCMRFLQGGGIGSMGLLSNLRSFLWIKVQQHTNRTTRVKLFEHFHAQDLKCKRVEKKKDPSFLFFVFPNSFVLVRLLPFESRPVAMGGMRGARDGHGTVRMI